MRETWVWSLGWPGEFHGLYSPWGRKESDTTERLSFPEADAATVAILRGFVPGVAQGTGEGGWEDEKDATAILDVPWSNAPKFRAVLVMIAQRWVINKWINSMWHRHTMNYHSAFKKERNSETCSNMDERRTGGRMEWRVIVSWLQSISLRRWKNSENRQWWCLDNNVNVLNATELNT